MNCIFIVMAYFIARNRRRKRYRCVENPFENFCDKELVERYRFDSAGLAYLSEIIEQHMPDINSNRGRPISPSVQLATALRYYATGSFQIVCGDLVNISQPSASRCITQITDCLLTEMNNFIKFPDGEELNRQKSLFYDIRGIPSVIGCIDCTHISIKAPGSSDSYVYINRKNYYSVNCQAVCDAERRFTHFYAAWPGSCHDSYIFRQSQLYNTLQQGPHLGYLLGDAGYPGSAFMLVPYAVPNGQGQTRYNFAHSGTRMRIEQSFGILKRRFGLLHKELQVTPEKACRLATACVILHNIAINRNVPLPEMGRMENVYERTDVRDNPAEDEQVNEGGRIIRDNIAASFL